MIIPSILTTSPIHFSLGKLGECTTYQQSSGRSCDTRQSSISPFRRSRSHTCNRPGLSQGTSGWASKVGIFQYCHLSNQRNKSLSQRSLSARSQRTQRNFAHPGRILETGRNGRDSVRPFTQPRFPFSKQHKFQSKKHKERKILVVWVAQRF